MSFNALVQQIILSQSGLLFRVPQLQLQLWARLYVCWGAFLNFGGIDLSLILGFCCPLMSIY
jgi:hypothetical protein